MKKLTDRDLEKIFSKYLTYKYRNPVTFFKMRAVMYFIRYTRCNIGQLMTLKRSDFRFASYYSGVKLGKKVQRVPAFLLHMVKDYFDIDEERINAFNVTPQAIDSMRDTLEEFAPDRDSLLKVNLWLPLETETPESH